jgi:DNA/RNA endonuclease G (NUC1)
MLYPVSAFAEDFVTVQNEAYFSIMDCTTRLPLAVVYVVKEDRANAKRYPSYIDDPVLLAKKPNCHPNTQHLFKTYQSVLTRLGIKEKYDVGHLGMSNHMDDSAAKSKLANQFSNLAPQSAKMNRKGGAWYHTEMILECLRDQEPLVVVAGTIDAPSTTSKNWFLDTFNQTTPDFFYRFVYFTLSDTYKTWLIPNDDAATKEKLESGVYDISLSQLDALLPIRMELFQQHLEAKTPVATPSFLDTKVGSRDLTCLGKTTSVS